MQLETTDLFSGKHPLATSPVPTQKEPAWLNDDSFLFFEGQSGKVSLGQA